MVQCKKYSESTAGNGTQRKTVIFTADIFTVYSKKLETKILFYESAQCMTLLKELWCFYGREAG